MAVFATTGLDEYAFPFTQLAGILPEVIDAMCEAEAEIIKKAQSETARSMLQGPYYKGGVAAGARSGQKKRFANGTSMYVTFGGTQHGNRIAEIAFINEYGKKGQPARQFIRTANEKYADKAVEAARKILDAEIARLGL